MERHFFVETESGTIFEVYHYHASTGQHFKLDTIEDFDSWANEVIHLSKIIDKLPEFLQGFFVGNIEDFGVFPQACNLSGVRRAWVEEWQ